ncbi:threonine/serine exporter family protein [Roseburia sp. MSJ-14]|uniref:threonine/serine exporter family protein n=1 Tax=Roseburia sp. MSJ-14 TaxID=2841514 RepID=UPI001C104135|nr:threonine/serine exporter family protein [Roseburia sp. MSJ-14]MBU5473694.1 threonine/serine exporter family protein [Roseburia sp. MSJ-14]
MIDQIIMSMVATIAFAILFNAPKKEYVFCALNGCIGWVSYQLFLSYGASVVMASLWATLILTLVARILSAIRRSPVTIFLVTGIFTLVPGAGIYYTSYYLIMNDLAQFTAKGIETFKIAGVMVLGIVFGLALPQSWFNQLRKITHKNR